MEHDDILSEMQKIRVDPHKYICKWMEGNLMHVGEKVFRILSLQPCSLILPDINFSSTNIKASFNILLLGSPSIGKSTIARKYSEFAYEPYKIRDVTAAKLSDDLSRMKLFSLILEDFSQIGNDYEVIKILEGALGEERQIQKRTKREETDVRTQGVGLLCGTWQDFNKFLEYFKSGMIFRMYLLFLDLSDKELSEIGRYINNGIGNSEISYESNLKEKVVKRYYEELFEIQSGEHEKIEQIKGYNFDNAIKEEIFQAWDSKVKLAKRHFQEKIRQPAEYSFTRELHSGYQFLVSHAFLNVHNRKIENNLIYPTKEDCDFAVKLMTENLNNKIDLLKAQAFLKMSTINDVRRALDSQIPEKTKKILANLSGVKGRR